MLRGSISILGHQAFSKRTVRSLTSFYVLHPLCSCSCRYPECCPLSSLPSPSYALVHTLSLCFLSCKPRPRTKGHIDKALFCAFVVATQWLPSDPLSPFHLIPQQHHKHKGTCLFVKCITLINGSICIPTGQDRSSSDCIQIFD
jgi:hypothetical protein